MKLFKSLLVFAAAAAAFSVSAAHAATASIGKPAPQFTLSDLHGQSVKLDDFKGKTVVLEWVNPECPVVGRHYEAGNIPALQKEALADGVVWLQINSGAKGEQGDYEPADATAWLKKHNSVSTAYLRDHDGKVGKTYGAKTTPHLYVINPDGVLVYNGAIDDNRRDHKGANNYVKAALASVKRGEPVAKATSEPYGCAVKY